MRGTDFVTPPSVTKWAFHGENGVRVNADEIYCSDYCNPIVAYMRCPPNDTRFEDVCKNCCNIKNQPQYKGCHLFQANGTLIC
ncbi:hypothetical protein DM860_010128 [Cuscuta australis]|uniref:Uncharacterized protein n=1 Tax=Cuscuta australis TaxID=267555 RepID=A0A328D7B9_9ASTE|nr:hypothetical protein DM860_010128 [Cuscuta australis]